MSSKKEDETDKEEGEEMEAKTAEEDDNFMWQDYLEVTNADEVPGVLFQHVEQSLQSGIQEGMKLEVPHKNNPNHYWIATIVMTCGPLLRLRYVGHGDDRTKDFWYDLTKVRAHPVGWVSSQPPGDPAKLLPPEDLVDKFQDLSSSLFAPGGALAGVTTVPPHLLAGDGFTPVDRIKEGMKLEIQDLTNAFHYWFATIIRNVGGRLLLEYEIPVKIECESSNDTIKNDLKFWLFYCSERIYHVGWVAKRGSPFSYVPPKKIKTAFDDCLPDWDAVTQNVFAEAKKNPAPLDLFQNNGPNEKHGVQEGTKLEAVHPLMRTQICPATVTQVFDAYYYLVTLDGIDGAAWCCHADFPYVFPKGWAKERKITVRPPDEEREAVEWREPVRTGKGGRSDADEPRFTPGSKLEAVNPLDPNTICVATVEKVVDHLVWIHLDTEDSFHPSHIVSMNSTDIFPVGWCESNLYPLKPPRYYHMPSRPNAGGGSGGSSVASSTDRKENSENNQRSFWCPKIYFNHKCFSGPFLSKGKLAQLPKTVGPGPVTLVMRVVLSMLISSAYKSSRVLKELQAEGNPGPGMHLEVLKAKYKLNSYRASVAVVTSADKIPAFCMDICNKLQCCPHMFGPELVGEKCPAECSVLSKTKFTQYWLRGKRKIGRPKGEASNLVSKPKQRRKRGRRRLFTSTASIQGIKAQRASDEGAMDVDGCDETAPSSPVAEGKSSPTHPAGNESEGSGSESRPAPKPPASTPQNNRSVGGAVFKRKYVKKEVPRMEMKTRGAKLPNFALQMRAGRWGKAEGGSGRTGGGGASLDCGEAPEGPAASPQEPPRPPTQPASSTPATSSPTPRRLHLHHHPLRPGRHSNHRPPLQMGGILPPKPAAAGRPHPWLGSNPLEWSVNQVTGYIKGTHDCAHLAARLGEEEIDGQAFMLLNLPTVQEHLNLKLDPAIKLCRHIEKLKFAFYMQYGCK
ncbi:LOW QUALITY PROTEIN: scm-like with four MBT domains protein 1 [Hetaerina americana]|uniref:LOW QUALITY PROTEIN: scm-like with four MBT domains protein 1 n=1 Tax=Hetaerina americana TaxID=62018 RepID=UPI003A7F5080